MFETRYHASRPYSSNFPPQQQAKEGGGGSLLNYLPFRGITQLKEKWSEYRQPRRLRRLASLFVSARGDYIAVASRNQITILQKDDEYQEPVGIFTCGNTGTFTCGTWSESHELLGVADDTDTIYIVKPNGEEMTRITKRHLRVSLPIVGLIVQDDASENKSYLCTFTIIVSDGSFHNIEISKDPSASIFSKQALNNASVSRQFPMEIFCWDYHPELSLFAAISSAGNIQFTFSGSTGPCSLSIWRRKKDLQMEPVIFTEFEGLYSMSKEYHGQLTSPKVLFSPCGKFVAALDMKGCLFTFLLDEEKCSLFKLSDGKSCNSEATSEISSSGTEVLRDILDFTWWANDVLTVARENGTIIMVDIHSYVTVSERDDAYAAPVLERAQQTPGLIFVLDSTLFEDSYRSSEHKGLIKRVTVERPNQFDFSKLKWSLVSLIKRSVLEIYDNLISTQRYQAALDFADRHGFDKDEVRKSQWLSSAQGVHEINTILPSIKDQSFVISECVDKVVSTEDAMRSLLSFGLRLTDSYRFSELDDNENGQHWNFRLARLKLLQFRDRLETFLGINMGRFYVQEYSRFRDFPISKAALVLAESGKIGALNLLFKRHPYSLIPSMLDVLAAIPETIPVQSYGQLLPAISSPSSIVLRDEDWVESEKMVMLINNLHGNDSSIQLMTEPIIKKHIAFQWPSISELSSWYKKRARDIDTLTGQLDNSMCLIDLAICKGISELQQFLEDISYLHQLIYSDESEDETNFSISLVTWEQLTYYEKFKLIMMGIKEDNVIPRLHKKAVPFMQRRFHALTRDDATAGHLTTRDTTVDSFLIRWLKEIATQNKLDMCLVIIEEGCRDIFNHKFFKDEVELVDCALQCIYLCTDIDRWSTMSTILSKLPQIRDLEAEDIKRKLKLAEGHVEAGRLLTNYQVPKPISFFVDAHSDEKGVKQILRLLLSKFIRCHPSRTDHDLATMWSDLLSLQEKAFPFLDVEYLVIEFCRGLLKAGKFSLARNYLKGTSSDKAETLVIQAAREYFFSAPTLACSEIWKAKECLNIFPSSTNVRIEADIIDAVTVRLPNLGVNLLPMAFRQIKDPMEIIKLTVTSQSGAYLNVDELIEIAKLFGLSSQQDISTVQEAIAREASFEGDVQLAFDLCLVLAKNGHGSIWDLCAALARSQVLDNMDSKSQKLLLGFALSYCDEESIGELLHEWIDVDMQDHCETVIMLTGKILTGKMLTCTLAALKSSQLVLSISPSLEITPGDIITVDSAVSCFQRVSDFATTSFHISSLLAILAEWEGLFTARVDDGGGTIKESVEESSDAANNNWSTDDWDEGWESFRDESIEKETKESNTLPIHPLHICWMTIIKKMVKFSNQVDILKLLDQNVGKSFGILLNEDDTRSLAQTALEMDCFLALKMILLLPYEAIHMQCLDAVENKLKDGGISSAHDHFFLVLILSSGILSSIITEPSYGTTFSYLCFMVGSFCRQFQEAQVSTTKHDRNKDEEKLDYLFVKLVFPCFIAELVKADQHILAGFLVTKFMHVNASLRLINIANYSLRKYLETQFREAQEKKSTSENSSFCEEPLVNTVAHLRSKLENLIQLALSLLPNDVR